MSENVLMGLAYKTYKHLILQWLETSFLSQRQFISKHRFFASISRTSFTSAKVYQTAFLGLQSRPQQSPETDHHDLTIDQ
jgi:hypothetical protein